MTTEIPAVVFNGPFRATKLWNDVVRHFRLEMPVRRHRRHIRHYENTFTAAEAIDFLHSHLKRDPNFGPNVTRVQTIQLLKKFLKSGLFERARGCRTLTATEDFKDNNDLYKFTHMVYSPNRAPLSQRSNMGNQMVDGPTTPKLHSMVWKASVSECEQAWKDGVLQRLQDLLVLKDLQGIVDPLMVSGRYVMHNATKLDARGVVTVPDKADELPHWILSAMKCLANWPNARGSGSCLPNYQGFEQDVFRVVRDYFRNLEEPLTTFSLYQPLVNILVRAEYLDVGGICPSEPNMNQFESVENLMMGMASHRWLQGSLDPPRPGSFETEFTNASPVTRIIVHPSLPRTLIKSGRGDLEKLRNRSGGYVNPCCPWEDMDSDSSYHTAPSHVSSRSLDTLNMSPTHSGNPMAGKGKECALRCFSVCFLMLAPGTRKKLHLLLRLMSKISSNPRLTLDHMKSNRNLLLETFTRCVLRAFREVDYDELIAPRLVAFLMDNHETLFQVPEELKLQVEDLLLKPRRSKARDYKLQSLICQRQQLPCVSRAAFCEQVSPAEYERQKATVARTALADLLQGIVHDPKLNGKDRSKKLKQFKRMYPEIYEDHFQTTCENPQPEPLQSARISFQSLQILKNVRL